MNEISENIVNEDQVHCDIKHLWFIKTFLMHKEAGETMVNLQTMDRELDSEPEKYCSLSASIVHCQRIFV